MIVMKFGGTSVGVPRAFAAACDIAARARARDPVVVVSALARVTNLLVELCREPRRRGALDRRFRERHLAHARAVGLPGELLDPLLQAWSDTIAEAPGRDPIVGAERDRVLAFGERAAATLFAAGLRARGVPAASVEAGDAGLVTDDRFGAAHPLADWAERLRRGLAAREEVPVVTGFLGRTEDGRVTTLGRGGSDYSAALIGAALGAEEIQIWTDTSGLLSADPRIVPEARPVPELSFTEASELAYFGAKVLHPKTLMPAMARGIPVRVLNTTRPDDPGSRIAADGGVAASAGGWRVKSIASKQGISALTIASTRMLLAHGFLARVFEVFGRHHIVVDLVTTSEVSISVTVDDTTRLDRAIAELEGIGEVELRHGLAVVAVVGEGAPARVGLAGHVFTLLGGVGIRVEMISQGASRVNLSFVVREEDADVAVRVLHRGLGLDLDLAAAPGAELER
jgi:aspartate kinase